jgi:hypothetical protein
MKAIGGITLEKYAELCARMDDVIRDKEACIKIAQSEGVSRDSWEKAHEGWQERITDPADMGRTASRFVPLLLAEVEKLKNSGNNNSPADPGSSSSPRSRKRKK